MPEIKLMLTLLIFILGVSLGSFLSVIQHRVREKKRGMFFGRSACPHCSHPLKTGDLMPLVSYLLLRGKCRYCEKKIGFYYFLLELTMGIIAVAVWYRFPFLAQAATNSTDFFFDWHNGIQFLLTLVESFCLIGIFFYDLQYLEIPDILLFPLIGIAFLGSVALKQTSVIDLLIAGVIALVFFGGQIVLSKGRWLGEGDLYLGLAMAFMFSWKLFLVSIVLTYFIGAIISLVLLAFKKVHKSSKVPFAPFMVTATFLTFFCGDSILNWYSNFLSL